MRSTKLERGRVIGPADDFMLVIPAPLSTPGGFLMLCSIERVVLLDATDDGLGGCRPPPPICRPAAAAEEAGASNPRTTSGPPLPARALSCELPRASEAAAASDGDVDGDRFTGGTRGLGEAARTSPCAIAADDEGVTETEGEGDLARAGTFETEALLLGVFDPTTVVEGDVPPFIAGRRGLNPSMPPPPLPRREEVLNPGGAGLGGLAFAPPLPVSLLDENRLVMSGLAVGGAETRRSANESEYRNSGEGARADMDRTGGGGYCCSSCCCCPGRIPV